MEANFSTPSHPQPQVCHNGPICRRRVANHSAMSLGVLCRNCSGMVLPGFLHPCHPINSQITFPLRHSPGYYLTPVILMACPLITRQLELSFVTGATRCRVSGLTRQTHSRLLYLHNHPLLTPMPTRTPMQSCAIVMLKLKHPSKQLRKESAGRARKKVGRSPCKGRGVKVVDLGSRCVVMLGSRMTKSR